MIRKTKFCEGLSDISDSYSAFILDQWGVLHDGKKVYDGVMESLEQLKKRDKFVIILSNSGKRAEDNAKRMAELGITKDMYTMIMTSGEMTWQGLKDRDDGIFDGLGTKCLLFSRGGDTSIVNGLDDIELVDSADEADFILISGSDAPDKTIEDYIPHLKTAIRRGLKVLCANPDTQAIMGDKLMMGAGAIARQYEQLGGVTRYIGKPHKPIFQKCIRILQENNIYPGDTVMVGDSLAHDIEGGINAMIDTCFIKNGLHANSFTRAQSPSERDIALNNLCAKFNHIKPNYMIDDMSWGKALPDRKHKKRDEDDF